MNGHVGAVRDVICDLDLGEDAWVTELARAFEPLMPDASRVAVGVLRLSEKGARLEKVGPHNPLAHAFLGAAARALPVAQLHEIMRRAPSTGSFSEWVRPLGVPNFWKSLSVGGLGMTDFVGLRALDGGDRFITVSAWYNEEQSTSEALNQVLQPLAAHIATMFRLRRSLAGSRVGTDHGEVILNPNGEMEHAVSPSRKLRERLCDHVRGMETAKTKAGTENGGLWAPLVEGRWTLIDMHDTDGRRYYVAVQNDPAFAGSQSLSRREQQVARMAAQGLANKEIGYSLDLSLSSVATYLQRALAKLRLQKRSELPMIYEQSARLMSDSTPPLALGTVQFQPLEALTGAEQDVVEAAVLGLSDNEIASRRGCSPRTVANLMRGAYRKLEVSNRTELVRVLCENREQA